MQRYFFDYVDQARSEFDFIGCVLPSLEKARQRAQLIALDEALHGERIGWKVRVCDEAGREYHSEPVQVVRDFVLAA
jgi:hypothetical protein